MISEDQDKVIDLFYFDVSGFCLIPEIPYAWQHKDNPIEIPSVRSKRLNVLGFLNMRNNFTAYVFESSVTTDVVAACFDDFSDMIKRRSIVIIDNAPTHCSDAFLEKELEWQEKGLFIYKLPSYSPELNKIEMLWKYIKYYWMPFEAYISFEKLRESLDNIICNIGEKYVINFV